MKKKNTERKKKKTIKERKKNQNHKQINTEKNKKKYMDNIFFLKEGNKCKVQKL